MQYVHLYMCVHYIMSKCSLIFFGRVLQQSFGVQGFYRGHLNFPLQQEKEVHEYRCFKSFSTLVSHNPDNT